MHQWCKLPLEDHRAITPWTFFNSAISFCILCSDLPRILRKYYDYNPNRYISKRSYSMIQLESRKIQSSSAICIRSALSTLSTYPIHLWIFRGAQPSAWKVRGPQNPRCRRGSYGHGIYMNIYISKKLCGVLGKWDFHALGTYEVPVLCVCFLSWSSLRVLFCGRKYFQYKKISFQFCIDYSWKQILYCQFSISKQGYKAYILAAKRQDYS